MDSERWQRVARLYESALEREPSERDSFLAEATAGDDELRREVESLLAHDSAPVLIDRPMLEAAAAILGDGEAALAGGQQFGPYRIDRFLGAGGMGQVYRATDTRLNRTVAIKVLPPTLTTDAQSRARFDREAKAIASLTHPHICTLHDVGHQDDVDFLVMEYLEGETLAARLERGPLPLDHALKCSIEIADALTTAHRHGIIHRDLKPSNIILTKGGAKLLDFGLAKPAASLITGGASLSPTTPPGLTAQGTILGTFQYMAPEQLEGKEADARTDIFAFGAVVYEMLTGKKAFAGKSQASLIGAIMHAEPPAIATAQPLTPPALDRIVKTCLAKDPDDRWQTARDLSRELQWVGHEPTATVFAPRRWTVRSALLASAAGVVIAALTGYAAWTLKPAPSPAEGVTRFSFTLPEDVRLSRTNRHVIALSPDGSRIVLVANRQLYLRNMADEELHSISGTGGDVGSPFFSPDGRWVAFWASAAGGIAGTLKKIPVTGGAPLVICETAFPFGVSWGADNQILIGGGPNGIQRVSAEGGSPEIIIKVNPGQLATNPQMLPDGDNVLFTLGEQGSEVDFTRQRNWDQAQIVVQSLKSGGRKVLINGGSDARYAPTGHIVYAFASRLWARPFDLGKLQVTGEPASTIEGVSTQGSGRFTSGAAQFSFSGTGAMAYVPGTARGSFPTRSLALIDSNGKVKRLDLPAGPYHSPRFSLPDGKQIVLYTSDGAIWIHDLSGVKSIRSLTLEGGNLLPMWTPNRRVVFRSVVEGQAGLFWQRADGRAVAERLTKAGARSYFPYSVSPDGKFLVVVSERTEVAPEILMFSLNGDASAKTIFQGAKGDVVFSPTLSPDGRWLAYEWRHENRNNIYVDPFPPTGVHNPVTTDGGSNPMWSRDGRRLFYLRGPGPNLEGGTTTFYSVEIFGTGASFENGKPDAMFTVDGLFFAGSGPGNIVDLSPDGKQFVTLLLPPRPDSGPESAQVSVILDFFSYLKQRVSVK
jgi:serine/threonine protein kinase/Tol biopolymer transport system component